MDNNNNNRQQPSNMKVPQSIVNEVNLNEYQLRQFTRVDFTPAEFDKIIYQKGARIIWEKAILCSCVNDETGQADYNCPSCMGRGFTYFDPMEIRSAVTSLTRNDEGSTVGMVDVGTAAVTTQTVHNVNFRDRLTFIDFTTKYSQVITVKDQKAKLKYDVNHLDRVMILSEALEEGRDYELNVEQTCIEFMDGVVEDEERVSVLMTVRPAYIVIDMIHELRGTFVNFGLPNESWMVLPKQLLIKREDLMPLKRGDLY